ncbi:MAG: hypothetical protein RLZZ71_427 [Bacteroidota bacterium]|jgi:hypothetical protein
MINENNNALCNRIVKNGNGLIERPLTSIKFQLLLYECFTNSANSNDVVSCGET